jgi:hypothetical protein
MLAAATIAKAAERTRVTIDVIVICFLVLPFFGFLIGFILSR